MLRGNEPFVLPKVGWGCWRLTTQNQTEIMRRVNGAIDAGITLFDTADVYGLDWGGQGFGSAEEALGKAFAGDSTLRDQVILATKAGIDPGTPYDSGRNYLMSAVEGSLRRMGVEQIDLFQIHRPDLFVHPGSLAETLVQLVESGKVACVGVSNYSPRQLETLAASCPIQLACNQIEYSLTHLDPLLDGAFDVALRLNVGLMAWSPLGGGALGNADTSSALGKVIASLCEAHQCSPAAISLAFVLAHPAVQTAIVGTQNPERMSAMAQAASIALQKPELYSLVEAALGRRLP